MGRAAALLFVLLSGCGGTHEAVGPAKLPELISMSSLPPLPTSQPWLSGKEQALHVLFCIMNDGRVREVRLLTSSGDTSWDRRAVDSMKQWQFAPMPDSVPGNHRWVRHLLIVKAQDPVMVTLGELAAESKHEADSLYRLLREGVNFAGLAQSHHILPSRERWFLGLVDISRFPDHVRKELRRLDPDEITPPIRLGTKYVIYKRFGGDSRQPQ